MRFRSEQLEMEIAERVLLDDSSGAMPTLRKFDELGILIALDDFGTGFTLLTISPASRSHGSRSIARSPPAV